MIKRIQVATRVPFKLARTPQGSLVGTIPLAEGAPFRAF